MSIFDLPPEEDRNTNSSVIHFLNMVSGESYKYIKDPDYYIYYRLGHDLRYGTIIFGLITFLISYFHTYYGLAPSLSDYPPQILSGYTVNQKMLGFYLHYINYSGIFIFPWMIFYFVWFYKNVDFLTVSVMRNSPKGYYSYRDFGSSFAWMVFVFFLLLLVSPYFVLQPKYLATIFFMDWFIMFRGFFDYPLFVLLVAGVVSILHTLFAQLFLTMFFLLLYFYYDFKNPPKG